MSPETFVSLGLPGAMLFILFFIVKYFVQAISKKDDLIIAIINDSNKQVNKLTHDFNVTVNNHIAQEITHHEQSTQVMKQMLETMQKMPNAIVEGIVKTMPNRQEEPRK